MSSERSTMVGSLRFWGAFVLLAALLTGRAMAEDPDKLPAPNGNYVSDFAGVIDAGSKQQMEALSRQVYEKAHATIVIVTVNSLDGDSIEDFSTRLEDHWKVGPKNTDRGLLMIFAIHDKKRRIEVGYGLEGILNDAKVGDIGRSMVPALQQGDYGAAILGGERQIAQVIADDAHVTLDLSAVPQHTYHYETVHHRSSGGGWIGLIIFIVIILLISRGGGGGSGLLWFLLGNVLGSGGRGGGRWGGGDGGGGGGGGGGDFGGGFGGGSGGGGASGDW